VDWEYRRVEVREDELPTAFETLDPAVGGLSLTMPLKEGILELVSDHRGPVDLLHAANTVVKSEGGWWLDNTDWWGVRRVLEDYGGVDDSTIWLLGAGATARSVLYALSTLRPAHVVMVVRDVARARVSAVVAQTLGLSHETRLFGGVSDAPEPQWVISTIPRGTVDDVEAFREVARGSVYFDAAYDPWPTPLAQVWAAEGRPIISGLNMLANQALAQVRCFVNGDSQVPLINEAKVLADMRESVGLTREPDAH
jgi:shikimate dehydrogenase